MDHACIGCCQMQIEHSEEWTFLANKKWCKNIPKAKSWVSHYNGCGTEDPFSKQRS